MRPFWKGKVGRVHPAGGFARGAKPLQRPDVHALIMPQDIEVAVNGAYAKINRSGRVPAVLHFGDLEQPSPQHKPQRVLIGAIPGVTFHSDLTHRLPPSAQPKL